MSALTDLFTAMANKIRTKTGTQTTYTPSEMVSDGIDDVFDAGVESATTPITPSNASPAGMTANVGYKPTANGYAISSYNNVTPSNSSPVALTSGEIDKMGGNGYAISGYDTINVSSTPKSLYNGDFYKVTGQQQYAVKSINMISPSNANPPAISRYGSYFSDWTGYAIESYDSVTPSSTPTSVASGDIVKIGGSGVIVDSIPTPTSITPSDSNPVVLTADTPVNPTTSGYAIASQPQSVTPSASGATFNSGIVNMSSGGYAYSQQPSSGYTLLKTEQLTFSSKTATLTGLTVGKEYMLIISFGWSNNNTGTNCQISSITNTSDLTLVDGGIVEYNGTQYCYTAWCIYTFTATGTSGVITKATNPSNPKARCFLFEKG